jgi:ATP-binding cassette subfamily B protein
MDRSEKNKKVETRQALSFIWQMARSFPGALTVMAGVALIWAVDLSLRPYLIKIILNRVSDSPRGEIFSVLAAPVGIYFLMTFLFPTMFRVYGYFVDIKMVPLLRKKIGTSIFETLLNQSHSYYQSNFSGSLSNKVSDLMKNIPELIRITFDRFLSNSLALGIAIFTLWQVNPKFALAMLTWALGFLAITLLCSEKLKRLSDISAEWVSLISGKIVDALSNILLVKLFSRQETEKEFLNRSLQESVKAEQKVQWTSFWIWFFYGYSFVANQGVCLYFLIKGRQEGTISVGDFALVLMINTALVNFLWELAKDLSQFSQYLGTTIQALRTLLVPVEIQDNPQALPLRVSRGEITFEHVDFHYAGAPPLFSHKSITLFPGQKVGLVGYSGSGKSTFVNLILRLFDVNEGRILIDSVPIKDVTQESLRQAIGTIPQDPTLFHRTLRENILYGRPHASQEDVHRAAQEAHAHDFIMALPQKYDSLVGERGVKLSGGQRQRIAIARAILKNAPILILDEATSQLDSVTESQIQESLLKLMEEKTTIVIAHRLSTLLHMDRILVFDQGKIREDGTHESLLDQGGLYKTLWEAQIGGFLPEKKEDKNESL